jgi:N-methylhydantoinase B
MSDLSGLDRQIMWNRLLAVVEEQAQTLMRTAFSPIVRENGDLSAGIFDRRGRMMAQAVTGTPGHVNTMAESVAHFLRRFPPETMREGDVYLTNDPWIGAGHLNDFVLVEPCFLDGAYVGSVACTTHLTDVGGTGIGPDGSDVYDEGLYLPLLKLADRGRVDRVVIDIIKANSRVPVQSEGDVYALIACADVGVRRLAAMMREFRLASLEALSDHIVGASERATIERIRAFPPGVYRSEATIDGYDFEIELKAALTITDRSMTVDFAGSSGPSRYGINVPLMYAWAYTVFGVKCIVAPEIPNNAGSLAPLRIAAPPGCIVNALSPAPVAMRHVVGQILPDVAFGCLHQAAPERVPAEGTSCLWDIPLRGGFRARPGGNATRFTAELVHNGGTGARPAKDGLSATAYPSGVMGSLVEITESTAPLIVRRREFRPDSGGAGRFRGGLGQIIELESAEGAPVSLFAAYDRVKYPPRGRGGGLAGEAGRVGLASGRRLNGKGEQEIPAGERLLVETPGGGGIGDPATRDPDRVAGDVRDGLVGREAAETVYRVVLRPDGTVDRAATAALRGAGPEAL